MLFTVCSWEEVRLKFVIANLHQDCREEEVSFLNGWKAILLQKDTFPIIYFSSWVSPGRQGSPCRAELQEQRAAGRQGCALHSPTAPRCPPCAAIISGVLPARSAAFTRALWLSSSCRHSTWSAKAAACRGVLGSDTHTACAKEGQHPHLS